MKFIKTELPGVILIEPEVFRDRRGFFLESYRRETFTQNGITCEFVQDNHSLSGPAGVIRGLHFQTPPFAQAKLIRVTRGRIYDVMADLRKGSETFGKWQSFELSSDNFRMIYMPEGFAHGFCTIEPETELQYKTTNIYSPEHDSGIRWNDPDLDIDWPVKDPIISEKDARLPFLSEFESPF